MPPIDARVVLELARAQQQEWIDIAAAERIAAGAAAATAAVAATWQSIDSGDAGPAGPLGDDAAGFHAALDALAEPRR